MDPLEDDMNTGVCSDHLVVFCTAELPRFQAYEWTSFSYIRQTEEGNLKFKEWMLD